MSLTLPTRYGPLSAETLHLLFEWAALFVGARLYLRERRRAGLPSPLQGGGFALLLGCLFGAAIGNKLLFLLQYPPLLEQWHDPQIWFAGQSIIGGLLGGLVGIEVAKLATGQRGSTGDAFVAPILIGLMVGRVGCFLAGLADGTYGNETALPWGVDFGDGLPRHPTQLYEILFCAALLALLERARGGLAAVPGLRFKLMLSAYLLWRLLIDGLKPLPYPWPGGLSGIQTVSAAALILYAPFLLSAWRRHTA